MNSQLQELRCQMDDINRDMAELFVKRMELSAKIANIKQEMQLPIEDEDREREILETIESYVPEALKIYTNSLFNKMFELSKAYQMAQKEQA